MKSPVILVYHRVLPPAQAAQRGALPVTPLQFEKHITFLVRRGWRSVTLGEFVRTWGTAREQPSKVFVITFDDGYRDNYVFALPILRRYGVRATVFLVADAQDGRRELYFSSKPRPYQLEDVDAPLSREQIREMMAYGIEFGSHTLSHPRLAELDVATAVREIRGSKAWLEEYLGRDVDVFCYPYGSLDERVIEEVRRAGYAGAAVTPVGPTLPESVYTVRRTGIYLGDTLPRLWLKCSGLFRVVRETRLWQLRNEWGGYTEETAHRR